MSLEVTGFCWGCGAVCQGLFCDPKKKKCKEKYERKQVAGIMKGKRAGYGAAGSTH